MDTNIATRLKLFFEFANITTSQFADNCGIARPTLSQILTGRNKKISDILIGQIHAAYPNLSILWLLFGEGDMLASDYSNRQCQDDNNDETLISPDGSTVVNVEPADTTLNYTQNPDIAANNQPVRMYPQHPVSRVEIAATPPSPRKISHITVYYDDSTFETFYPKE